MDEWYGRLLSDSQKLICIRCNRMKREEDRAKWLDLRTKMDWANMFDIDKRAYEKVERNIENKGERPCAVWLNVTRGADPVDVCPYYLEMEALERESCR
jgi:hypothetical protein